MSTLLIGVQSLALRTYTTSTENEKLQRLLELLSTGGDAIVYATTQKDTLNISEALGPKLGDKANIRTYHAGMKTETRNEVQEWFMNKNCITQQKIVVCTIAFGMGIDKSDIRQVIHYKMPKNLEGYRFVINILAELPYSSDCGLVKKLEGQVVMGKTALVVYSLILKMSQHYKVS